MVIPSDLNVRESPDISSKIIGLVHQGDTFKVIQTKDSWDQIKLSSSQTGWVYNAYIQRMLKNNSQTSVDKVEATVEAIDLNVREAPSLSSPIVGNLKLGNKNNSS